MWTGWVEGQLVLQKGTVGRLSISERAGIGQQLISTSHVSLLPHPFIQFLVAIRKMTFEVFVLQSFPRVDDSLDYSIKICLGGSGGDGRLQGIKARGKGGVEASGMLSGC